MKLLITGLACSGKSTLSRLVADVTGLPLVHMDRIIWQENWVKSSDEHFIEEQDRTLSRPNWIYEGFNLPTLQNQVKAADQIIFINKSRLQLTFNYLKRLRRHRQKARPDMPDGNIEHFNLKYIKWLWKYKSSNVLSDIQEYAHDKNVSVVRSKRDIKKLLTELGKS